MMMESVLDEVERMYGGSGKFIAGNRASKNIAYIRSPRANGDDYQNRN